MHLKQHAKQAKKRLGEGFWEAVLLSRCKQKQDAVEKGQNLYPIMIEHQEKLRKQILSEDYNEEEQFEMRVKQLLAVDASPSNPMAYLADQEAMKVMSSAAKQAYLLKLSARYRKVAEKLKAKNQI